MQSDFAVKGAKQSTGSGANMQIVTRPKSAVNYNVQEKHKAVRSLLSRDLRKDEEANTECRKTSKLIAYISTKSCKGCQCECTMPCQSPISIAENSSVHEFKSVQLTPN